jgi:peptide deformylase
MQGKILKILINPHPKLRKKSTDLDISQLKLEKTKQLLADMKESMLKKDGAGLAAPQVGINKRIIVLNHESSVLFMINPEITKLSYNKEVCDEGCLSVVNEKGEVYYKPVSRHKWLNCKYIDQKGKIKKLKARNNLARAIQHEIDHLDGILFIDYLK